MSLSRLLLDAARRTPDAVAVVDAEGPATYATVDALANGFALALQARGVRPGDRVGVWADKSMRAVAALQGALRVGAAYVPLDPKSPVQRVVRIAAAAELAAIVTTSARMGELVQLGCSRSLVNLDAVRPTQAQIVAPVPAHDDLAYILFTSGSTGQPKGVCLSHGNALAFVRWAVDELQATPADRFANHAPLHFDLSVLDLYVPFAVGARVCLVPDGLAFAPRRLVGLLAAHGITVWYSVPTALALMMRHGDLCRTPTPALRAVLFAGEPFPVHQLRALMQSRPGVRLLNLYGPTETNVCTFHEVRDLEPERSRPVPIGRACCGNRVWAVRSDGTEAGPGEQGELWVEGPTVMQGYWGAPAHRGPYATGDLVTVQPDGSFEYTGRRDQMVKVRGYRVELGEVETVLASHPAVDAVCVVARGQGADTVLAAWVVAASGQRPSLLALKRHCAAHLPAYMTVGELHVVDRLPTTRNGKIGRRQLLLAEA
ncbi:MAG: amino acid adenylation domain-containing protein [Myxococcales bacterium]|nr:amino acid adenylation domain-containing protein [Myxococcales bacterium]